MRFQYQILKDQEEKMKPYKPPCSAKEIPVIDLTDSYSGDLEKRKRVAWEIHKTCRDTGFFYVSNHTVPQKMMDAHLTLATEFFKLPTEEKQALDSANEGSTRGYEAMVVPVLNEGLPPDLKEGFMSSVDTDEDHIYTKLNVPVTGRNQWPASIPEFQTKYEAYVNQVLKLGRHLAQMLALSLELPENYFDECLKEPLHYCRILRYPPHPKDAAPNQLSAGTHTDWGLLTILLQDKNAGLEVQNTDGEWISAPPIPGTYIINLGEMVRVITNGLYKATPHRVLNNISGNTRYSAPVFFDPEYFYKVKCAPTCMPEIGDPKFPEMTAGEHLRSMFEKSFGANT